MTWTKRKGQVVLAGAAAAVVAVLVVWGIVIATSSDDNTAAVATSAQATDPTETTTEEPSPDTESFGQLTPKPIEGARFRFESPDDVTWYPLSDEIPKEFTATRSKGFPRNEEGAALAAWHILGRASGFNPDGYIDTFDEQVTGEGKAAMQEFAQLALTESVPGEFLKSNAPLGYDVVFFNPLNAEIKIYAIANTEPAETRDENKVAIPIKLLWEDNDWKLVAPEDGITFGSTVTPIDPQFTFGGDWS